MTSLLTLYALSAFALSNPPQKTTIKDTQSTIRLGHGDDVSFIGESANSVESFLNIRFGQDTSGNNRFAPPKAYAYPYGSVVNASQAGAACPQQMVPIEDFSIFDNVTNIPKTASP